MKIQLRKRLGDLLVEEGIVSEDQIQQALSAQRSTGQKLGDALIDLGFITEKQMLEFFVSATRITVDRSWTCSSGCGCGANTARSACSSFTCNGGGS